MAITPARLRRRGGKALSSAVNPSVIAGPTDPAKGRGIAGGQAEPPRARPPKGRQKPTKADESRQKKFSPAG